MFAPHTWYYTVSITIAHEYFHFGCYLHTSSSVFFPAPSLPTPSVPTHLVPTLYIPPSPRFICLPSSSVFHFSFNSPSSLTSLSSLASPPPFLPQVHLSWWLCPRRLHIGGGCVWRLSSSVWTVCGTWTQQLYLLPRLKVMSCEPCITLTITCLPRQHLRMLAISLSCSYSDVA